MDFGLQFMLLLLYSVIFCIIFSYWTFSYTVAICYFCRRSFRINEIKRSL